MTKYYKPLQNDPMFNPRFLGVRLGQDTVEYYSDGIKFREDKDYDGTYRFWIKTGRLIEIKKEEAALLFGEV
jgi:hypothetical protein